MASTGLVSVQEQAWSHSSGRNAPAAPSSITVDSALRIDDSEAAFLG